MKTIVFTGGGTAGHVTPNISLIDALDKDKWQIHYIGSKEGIEKAMIDPIGVPFHAIKSGKLRRYFSFQNFIDPLNVLIGIVQSYWLIRKLKPQVVFSKGGFVALPVVMGAYLNRVPVIAHESDIIPGLANRLSFPFVTKICVTFESAKNHFKQKQKIEVTGTPLRQQLFQGDKARGLAWCGFDASKPCVLVVGGSQGSSRLNDVIRRHLSIFTEQYQVIHLCGKGKLDAAFNNRPGYFQMEYANEELPDLMAASDVVISRAGANALYEILALSKPHVLIPLSSNVSNGHQIHNATYFEKQGISTVLNDDGITANQLLVAVNRVYAQKEQLVGQMKALDIHSATDKIITLLENSVADKNH